MIFGSTKTWFKPFKNSITTLLVSDDVRSSVTGEKCDPGLDVDGVSKENKQIDDEAVETSARIVLRRLGTEHRNLELLFCSASFSLLAWFSQSYT